MLQPLIRSESEVSSLIETIVNLREARRTVLDELGRAEAALIAHMRESGARAIPHKLGTAKLKEPREYDANLVLANLGEKLPPEIPLPSVVVMDALCKKCGGVGREPAFVDGRQMLKVRKLGDAYNALADASMLPAIPRLVIE